MTITQATRRLLAGIIIGGTLAAAPAVASAKEPVVPEPTATVVAAPTTTIPVAIPVPAADDLDGIHAYCSRQEIIDQFKLAGPSTDRFGYDFMVDYATDENMTLDELLATFNAERYNAAERTLTISSAFAQDDDDNVTTFGLFDGLIYDCVMEATQAPERVTNRIQSTRALDGMQDDAWGPYQAMWTFHPDDGLNITIWMV